MLRAFKLYTGPDHASHVLEGTIDEKDRTDVVAIHFQETPAHSSYDWHPAPEKQFVITLSGTLEFVTPDGEKFVVRPGDILLAEDNAGEGHKWRPRRTVPPLSQGKNQARRGSRKRPGPPVDATGRPSR